MMHPNRVFHIAEEVTSVADLSENLTQHTWTLCTAFKLVVPDVEPLLFVNDSPSEDDDQVYAVIRQGRHIWSCPAVGHSRAEAHNEIAWLAAGGGGDYDHVALRLEPVEDHSCPLCCDGREE